MARYFIGDYTRLGSVRRDETELGSYRFGRRREGHARSSSALHRADSHLKAFVQSIADARFRRMLRELELRGTRLDTRDELWIPDELLDRDASR